MLSDVKYALHSLSRSLGFTANRFAYPGTRYQRDDRDFQHRERGASAAAALSGAGATGAESTRNSSTSPTVGCTVSYFSPAEYIDLRREAKSWQSIEGWESAGVNVASATAPLRVTASFITGGFLPSLGIGAMLGRVILPQDDQPGAAPVVVISYRLWKDAFGGDRAILGREILVSGGKATVVGVMPGNFQLPLGAPADVPGLFDTEASDLWMALQIDPLHPDNGGHSVAVLGRLKPGVTLRQAQVELASLVSIGAEPFWPPLRSQGSPTW